MLYGSIHRTMGSFRVRTGCHVIRVGTISWQWRVGSVQKVSWMYFLGETFGKRLCHMMFIISIFSYNTISHANCFRSMSLYGILVPSLTLIPGSCLANAMR